MSAAADLDEGEQRWNAAVKKGGKALLDARATARNLLEAEAQEVAKLGMREARWIKDSDSTARTSPNSDETSAERMIRELRAAQRADLQDPVTKEESTAARERLPFLHEVRLPDGAVQRCKVCDAAIAYVGCCANCTGLWLQVPAKDYFKTVWAAAGDGSDTEDGAGSASDTGDTGEPDQRRSSRLQTAKETPVYVEDSSDSSGEDAVTASRRSKRGIARSGRGGRGKGQQAPRVGRGNRRRMRVPRGVLRLAGMRMDYVDDIMVAEADENLNKKPYLWPTDIGVEI
jgi:hypothetical protein